MKALMDCLANLKQGSLVKSKVVLVPKTTFIFGLLGFLQRNGYVLTFSPLNTDDLGVVLKFRPSGKGIFDELQIYSKPSQKIYWKVRDCKEVSKHSATKYVLTTNQGLMFAEEAARRNVGGKLLFSFSA